jgi:signal transduction histidine kinase
MADDRSAQALLEAVDAATVAIAQELSLDRVLQLIVDRVRPLVSARYAALALIDEGGGIERFITSGIDEAQRAAIGHPPRGIGLLGAIVREGRSVRVADLSKDPRHAGFPPHHPRMTSLLGVPIRVDGRAVGNLYLTDKSDGAAAFDEVDERIVESFARHAGIAIRNARLNSELQQLAVLRERERIAQDLHDGTIQALYAVSLALEDTAETMAADPDGAVGRIDRAIESIHASIRGIRDFIMGLDPEWLASMDLASAIASLADEIERNTLIDVILDLDGSIDFDADETMQLVQLTREAISNVARHASATSVRVSLRKEDGLVQLSIVDNGQGFDPDEASGPGHHGLGNMRARADALGGSLTIDSRAGAGTRVILEIPSERRSATREAGS